MSEQKKKLPFSFACVRADKTGGRCQNLAIVNSVETAERWHDCIQHLREDDPPMPDMPKYILLQFFLNWKSRTILEQSEVHEIARKEMRERVARRQAEALRLGRDPNCPVFGKGGLKKVGRLDVLHSEILTLGYVLVNQHWYYLNDKPDTGAALVCGFRVNPSPEHVFPITDSGRKILENFLACTWVGGHVHAKAPDENGEIVHSLELIGMQPHMMKNCLIPEFNSGMWWATPRLIYEDRMAAKQSAGPHEDLGRGHVET